MGKRLSRATDRTKTNETKEIERIDPLANISGIAYDMELQISDAIGVVRTALERRSNDEDEDCGDALGLIWFRLEQIQEGHALIVKNAPYGRHVPGEEGKL